MTKIKNTSKIFLSVAAMAICLFSPQAQAQAQAQAQDCIPKHEFSTISPGTLTVVGFEFPPYVYRDGQGLNGIDAEILKRFAALECLSVSGSIVDASAVIQSVISGRADIAAGIWYRTAERAEVVGLVHPIYLDRLGLYSKEGYSKISDIEGKRVGTIQGYLWVSDLEKLVGDNLTLYPNPVAMAQDLAAGRIDVGADSYDVGIHAQRNGGLQGIQIAVAEPDERVAASIEPGQAGLPYTKSNTALGEALDSFIIEMHETGEIKEILSSFGLDPAASDVGEPRLIQ